MINFLLSEEEIMGKTIVEKILSAHTDTDNFKIGDIIKARVDFAFANDISYPKIICICMS